MSPLHALLLFSGIPDGEILGEDVMAGEEDGGWDVEDEELDLPADLVSDKGN